MRPTVSAVGPEKPNEVTVSLGALSASELDALAQLLPALTKELASRWPIKDIRVLRRNPHQLSQTETALAVALVTGVLKPLAERLSTEILDWWKRTTAKKKKRKRRTGR